MMNPEWTREILEAAAFGASFAGVLAALWLFLRWRRAANAWRWFLACDGCGEESCEMDTEDDADVAGELQGFKTVGDRTLCLKCQAAHSIAEWGKKPAGERFRSIADSGVIDEEGNVKGVNEAEGETA